MSGATQYDRLLGARYDTSRRLHAEELQVQRACARMEHEVRRHAVEQDTNERMRRAEERHRSAQSQRAARERLELEERMAQLMRTRRA
ncbi:hypothetical protein SHKM778_87710 [Streptomyces sp. KM77-8]|uniref:Uncharacterized protein n=1 Tax=Streptomyces haneummycinicus TaxID=3074435 RepID=A0AAT9HXF4_9ACTN